MIFLLLVFFIPLIFLYLNLDKKLLMLLSLEMCFLSMIIYYFLLDFSPTKSSYMIFLLSSMMVIDSVFSLSILISCGRCSDQSNLKVSIF